MKQKIKANENLFGKMRVRLNNGRHHNLEFVEFKFRKYRNYSQPPSFLQKKL